MMRKNSRKLLTIIIGLILTFACIPIFSSVFTTSKVHAQEKSATDAADKIKAILLRPGGWLVECRGKVADLVFEERGENVVVKIDHVARNLTCEREVKITSDVVKLDGCRDRGISLFFDPNDQEYPFKGESYFASYKLKAK